MPETCAVERNVRDTGSRCMVPGSCKGVFPKRLTDKDRRIESWTA